MLSVVARVASALVLASLAGVATAATKEISPGQSFETAVESLQPGDTLIVHAGNYSDSGRISVTVQGTAALPVVIKGADGETPPHIQRPGSAAAQNTINIEGARYLTLQRLEISSNGGDGINLSSSPQFITIDGVEIHDVDVGVNFRSSMNNIIVRNTHIHNTGIADGSGTGEGMYVGCNDAACVVRDSVFEHNWIHDTKNSTQGDGIEIKLGSHSNVVRDNVIHDTGYPCVLVYGTTPNPVNIIEGNVMWRCGDSGIQAAADAIIRNNIIIDNPGSNSFNSQPHQAAVPQDLQFVHNTIVTGDPCVRVGSWNNRTGLVIANNAIYCNGDNFVMSGLAGVSISGNVINPSTSSFPTSGYTVGQSTALDLVSVATRNVYPTAASRLINAGDPARGVSVDFNGNARSGTPDAGAYEWNGATNPGWAVQPGFKGSTTPSVPQPTITLTADPASIPAQSMTTLTWSTTNANSCTASGGWTGSKSTSGSESRGPLATTTTFTLVCQNTAGGSATKSVTVTVAAATPAPTVSLSANPSSVALNGSSTLSWTSTNATSCTATGGLGGWSGNKATMGSQSVGPFTATTAFALSCTGSGGTASDTETVSIAATPPPPAVPTVTVSASPTTIASGERSTLTWSTTGASSCVASGAWTGNKSTSGNEQTAALTATSTYTLTCSGAGGSASGQRVVTVQAATPPPPAPPPPDPVPVEQNDGGGGGGALDFTLLAALLALQGVAILRRRDRPN